MQSGKGIQSTEPPLLSIHDLSVEFGDASLIDGVSLELHAGKTHGLVGESGSGKSVTAMSVLGLFDKRFFTSTADRIDFEGRNIFGLPEKQMEAIRGSDISMIFQEPMTALNPVSTIGEQIIETLCIHQKMTRRQARAEAAEILARVQIPAAKERLGDYPHQMSGGMRQRVMIAIAIACRPKLLIADEPTTALDVTIQAQILELLHNLQAELGMGILLITHDLGVVAGYAQDMSVMYCGRVVETGTVAQIYGSPQHPYTEGLLASHPPVDEDVETLIAIPGNVPQPDSRPSGCNFSPRCQYSRTPCSSIEPELMPVGANRRVACIRHSNFQIASRQALT